MGTSSIQEKYNIAVAKAQDLQEQLAIKTEQWSSREKERKHVDKLVRELCIEILEKDQGEYKCGEDFSWDNLNTDELITRAKNSYKMRLKNEGTFLKKVLDESEERLEQISSLEQQIAITLENQGGVVTREQLKDQVEREKEKEKAYLASGIKVKDNIDSGALDLVTKEESDFVNQDEIDNTTIQINHHATPVKAKRGGKQDRSKKTDIHNIDLNEWDERFEDEHWAIIATIGGKGISEYPKIETYIIGKNTVASSNKLRDAARELEHIGVLDLERVSTPKAKVNLYSLTNNLGKRLYYKKTGEKAITSQLEELRREHDNAEHGLTIQYIAEALEKSGDFKNVEYMTNRKAIEFEGGKKYIPDIVCTEKSGRPLYIEYECGTTGQHEFNGKCNKMAMVTNDMYFFATNVQIAKKLASQVTKWIDNRHAEALKEKHIYIGSARDVIRGAKIFNEGTWCYIFEPAKRGSEPVIFPTGEEKPKKN